MIDRFESGVPVLSLRDPNETPSVVVSELGVGLLDAKNPNGNTSVQITMESQGPSLLCVKDGKLLWSAR